VGAHLVKLTIISRKRWANDWLEDDNTNNCKRNTW